MFNSIYRAIAADGGAFLTKFRFRFACVGVALFASIGTTALHAQSGSQATAPVAPQASSSAQSDQNSQVPNAPTPQKQESERERAARELRHQEQQRIFGIVPYFNTSNVPDAAPLSPKQKFQLMFHGVTDPFEFVAVGLVAGFGQANDSHSGYGQGAEGYAKRYGAAYADAFDGALWGNAILPSLLHQDPRYFRRGYGSITRRTFYSLSTAVWGKNDNGKWGPNYSNVAGNIIAGGVSNLYYPQEDRGIGLTFQGAAIVTAEGALGSLFWEFWPDLAHKWFHTPLPNSTAAPRQP